MNETISLPPIPPLLPVAPPPLPSLPADLLFTGRRSEFTRLVTRGALLELVTLGFYRFWLATDMRRHLWSHTSVNGDAPEYTGTAKELLIGFLFALAILVPIYLVYFLHRPRSRTAAGLRQHPARPVLLPVRPVRDLSRAPLPADAHGLARRALLDDWLGLELCLARRPVGASRRSSRSALRCRGRAAALERYKMRHTSYGDLQGRFEATGWEFFKRGWWLWLLAWPAGCFRDSAALHLCGVQGDRVALVDLGHPHRRRALRVRSRRRRLDRPLLEGDRLERAVRRSFCRCGSARVRDRRCD